MKNVDGQTDVGHINPIGGLVKMSWLWPGPVVSCSFARWRVAPSSSAVQVRACALPSSLAAYDVPRLSINCGEGRVGIPLSTR